MIIVSGCPRSGTSMMMRIMERVFGEGRILGEKKLFDDRRPALEKTEIANYLWYKSGQAQQHNARVARAKQMNPNGYYEMAFSVRGVFYSAPMEDKLNELLTEIEQDKPRTVCKIVSQGLANSDPRYIDKIVYMVRDPRSVAKSQENLTRQNPMSPENAPVNNGKKVLIRSVAMFNQVTIQAAQWIAKHPSIPVYYVNYEDMLQQPEQTLAGIQEFLGEGDFTQAVDMIDKSLFRSVPDGASIDNVDFALELHAAIKAGNTTAISNKVAAKIEEAKKNPKPPTQWFCPRLMQTVAVEVCKLCHGHPITRENLKANAIQRNIEWRKEPCPYECGIQGGEGLSVAESIAKNHWLASTE